MCFFNLLNMICPCCKKRIKSGSKFCMYCGAKIFQSAKQTINEKYYSNDASTLVNALPTAGKKTLITFSKWLLYISVALLVLSVISKFVYQETIIYGYPTADSDGYYLVHNTEGPGEQWVYVRVYPISKVVEGVFMGSRVKSFDTRSEVDSSINQLRAAALDEYQDNMNSCIIVMIIATIVIAVLERLIVRNCKPQNPFV